MSQAYLVRHPAPHPTESLPGYLLRLGEANGYTTPWAIYQLAQMKQSDVRGSGMKVDKLAKISRQSEADLQRISFASPLGRSRWCRLLGHSLVPTELSTTAATFCVQCACERGFIEAHWHLSLMVGCPIHACKAVSQCPACGTRIRWFRPGILECECGFDLREVATTSISLEEVALLDVIRRKTLALPPNHENPASIPQNELLAMELRTILIVVQAIGKYRLIADGRLEPFDSNMLVLSASRVFSQWPVNFTILLQALGEGIVPGADASVRKQFESIYSSLFKNKTIIPQSQTDFLREAFIDFATNHWGRGVIDRRLLRGPMDGKSTRFMTQAAFADHLGVRPRTAARFLIDQKVPTRSIRCGGTSRIIVDAGGLAVCRSAPGKVLRIRDAARQLGMSPQLLQRLKNSGSFEVRHLSPVRPGFHATDVQCFKDRLLGLARCIGLSYLSREDTVPLRTLLRSPHSSLEIKAMVVSAILAKEMTVLCDSDGTVDGLLIGLVESIALVAQARKEARGHTLTPTEASHVLECQASAVPGLLLKGLLQGQKTLTGVKVTAESVKIFGDAYCSVASIAKRQNTRSRWIIRLCKERGVGLVLASVKAVSSPQAFIFRAEVPLLSMGSGQAGRIARENLADERMLQRSTLEIAEALLGSTPTVRPASSNRLLPSDTRVSMGGNTR